MPKKNTVNNHKVTYKKSGVSIENADKLISMIKPIVRKTHDNNVIGDIGGFGALYDISKIKYKKPILVSGTDGVGTKLKLAIKLKKLIAYKTDIQYYSITNPQMLKKFEKITKNKQFGFI